MYIYLAFLTLFFFFNDTATTEIYTLSLHDALPICPIISAIPAVLVAYLTSPVLALMVTAAFFVIQQLENHVIVPQVMKKAVGLNPLIVILAVAIGGKLLGISGALLAVPIAVVIQILTGDVLKGQEF